MKINREELLTTLNAVSPGLANKEIIEQSTCFVFKKNRVFTFNDEIAVSSPTPLDIVASVPATQFHSLISKMKKEEIELEIKSNELRIKESKAKAGIKIESEISIPIEEIGQPDEWEHLPKEFIDAVSLCLPSCSTDMSKPILTNIFLTENGIWSSDVDTMSYYQMDFSDSLFIPSRSLNHIKKYQPTHYSITNGWIHFKCENEVIFSCRTYESEKSDIQLFESLQKHINVEGTEVKFPNCKEVLEQAGIFSLTQFEQDNFIIVSIEDNLITIRGEGEYGWFEKPLRMRYKNKPVQFQVQPMILIRILNHSNRIIIGKNSMKFESGNFHHMIYLEEV